MRENNTNLGPQSWQPLCKVIPTANSWKGYSQNISNVKFHFILTTTLFKYYLLRFVNKIFIWILLDLYLTYNNCNNLAFFAIEYSRKLGSVRVLAYT